MTKFESILLTFSVFKQGNHSELCKDCKLSYKRLDDLYSRMDENQTLCIDIEDAVSLRHQTCSTLLCLV